MRLIYMKPKLKDLSQGSRIAFARQFRQMSQDDVSDKLGLKGDRKRRTMARYEKEDRIPKDVRLLELAKILNVSINSIKSYEFKEAIDSIYHFMWLEELYPDYKIDLYMTYHNENSLATDKCMKEWSEMRKKRAKREISYEEYIDWKLNYEIKIGGE